MVIVLNLRDKIQSVEMKDDGKNGVINARIVKERKSYFRELVKYEDTIRWVAIKK